MNPWDRQPGETAKAFSAFVHYRDIPAIDRSVAAAWGKAGGKQWEKWCTLHDWVDRAAENDSDIAARRRERMAKEVERSEDTALLLIRAALAKVRERIEGLDAEELAAGQIPAALKTLIELEFKTLGREDKIGIKHEGKIEIASESADAAWLLDYVRQLQERSVDEEKPEG